MNVLRLCGHETTFPEDIALSPVDRRWMQTSDCTECRTDPKWEPSDGHLSREDFIRQEKVNRSPSGIRKAVCDHFMISVDEMISKNREVRICLPRQIAMYLAKTMTDYSYQALAPIFGRTNHATVWHGVRKIRRDMKKDEALAESIKEIQKRIETGAVEE